MKIFTLKVVTLVTLLTGISMTNDLPTSDKKDRIYTRDECERLCLLKNVKYKELHEVALSRKKYIEIKKEYLFIRKEYFTRCSSSEIGD